MRRILWKRGMRLTDEILRTSDECTAEVISKVLILAAGGRFGLLPSSRPFHVALNITQSVIDVESLNCLAVTQAGDLIDAQYDTRYTNNYGIRVPIPEMSGTNEYILTINASPDQWKESIDGMEEPVYTFSLVGPDSVISEHSFPIARIVDDHGWRMDDVDFVPPCLFVSSHRKFMELLHQFADVLAALDTKSATSTGRSAVRLFWPFVQQLRIAIDKEHDLMTPMMLLSNVQKCVSAFTCACDLDETLELADAKMFRSYVLAPYNYRDAYQRIKVGLEICFSISEKVSKLSEGQPVRQEPLQAEPARPEAPTIAPDKLNQECNTSETAIPILYNNPAATVYFTVDGSEPTIHSIRAPRTKTGFTAKFDNGYRKEKGKEADKSVIMKIFAVVDGVNSQTANYTIMLHKGLKFRNAIPI